MNAPSSSASTGWNSSRESRRIRFRNRDLFAPVLAIGVITLSHAMAVGGQALPLMTAAFLLVLAGVGSVLIAGPRHVTTGMALVGALVLGYAAFQAAGPLDRAFADLAVLVAAGGTWIVGFVVARQGRTLDLAWTVLVWASLAYCVIVFFGALAEGLPQFAGGGGASATGPLTYALLLLLGAGRVLHMIKRLDAEAAPESEMVGRIIQQGLGGILLVCFALACLIASASVASVLMTAGVLIGYCVWDLHNIIRRAYSPAVRILGWIAPQVAVVLVVWGGVLVFFDTAGAPEGLAGAGASMMTRLEAYFRAFLDQPILGHGFGAIEIVGAKITTLYNANAMLVEGGARNVLVQWLVEAGLVGTVLMALVLIAMHVQIAVGFRSKRTPRTFLRLAFATSALMLVHGLAHASMERPNIVWFYALVLGIACGVATVGRERASDRGSNE